MRRIKTFGMIAACAAGLALAAPAAAQQMGEGYEFLKAVKAATGPR